jgi:predicted enzyme related to lactoylglutathione lyase
MANQVVWVDIPVKDLDQAIAAVEANGGKVLQPKHPIGPYVHRAIILDSEGNRMALHSG